MRHMKWTKSLNKWMQSKQQATVIDCCTVCRQWPQADYLISPIISQTHKCILNCWSDVSAIMSQALSLITHIQVHTQFCHVSDAVYS